MTIVPPARGPIRRRRQAALGPAHPRAIIDRPMAMINGDRPPVAGLPEVLRVRPTVREVLVREPPTGQGPDGP